MLQPADFAFQSDVCGVRPLREADVAGLTNTQALGSLLYTKYAFIFQAAGMILLTALIGAVVLTHRKRTGVRRQNIADQVAREPGEVLVMMQPGVGQGVEIK